MVQIESWRANQGFQAPGEKRICTVVLVKPDKPNNRNQKRSAFPHYRIGCVELLIMELSYKQKRLVIQALENMNCSFTTLHEVFDMEEMRFKPGVFRCDGSWWVWPTKSKRWKTDKALHDERYTLFRSMVHYALYLTTLEDWDFMQVACAFRVIQRRGQRNVYGFMHAGAA